MKTTFTSQTTWFWNGAKILSFSWNTDSLWISFLRPIASLNYYSRTHRIRLGILLSKICQSELQVQVWGQMAADKYWWSCWALAVVGHMMWLPSHQHHMGKNLCCSVLLVWFVFFFEKLSEVQGVECPTVISPSFHVFDTITETSQLVHQQVRPELTLSTYYNSDLPSLTHHMWATFFCAKLTPAQQEWPLLCNSSHFASSIFKGVPGQEQGWSIAAGEEQALKGQMRCAKFVLAVSYSCSLLGLSLCMCLTGVRTSITWLTEYHTSSHMEVEGLNNSQTPVINFSYVLESCSYRHTTFQTGQCEEHTNKMARQLSH